MTKITCPQCGHHIFNLDSQPNGQSAGATSSPPAAAPSQPSCPQHGPMTFHDAKTKPDGKRVSARYSCDVKIGDEFCPTKAVWL